MMRAPTDDGIRSVFPIGLLCVALSAGCVQIEQTLRLDVDGSGEAELIFTAPDEVVAAAMGRPGDASAGPEEAALRTELAASMPEGVQLDAFRMREVAGAREIRMRLGFRDLKSLGNTPFFADNRLTLTDGGEGRRILEWSLTPPGAGFGADLSPADDPPREGFPEGFRATFTVSVPGPVITANTEHSSERGARWVLAATEAKEGLRFLNGEPMRVEFEAPELDVPAGARMRARLPPPS